VLEESLEIEPIAAAVTRYVARRLVAREQMLAGMDSEREIPLSKTDTAQPAENAGKISDPWFMLIVGIGFGVILSLMAFALR
jgi:hypothetical protein